MGEYATAREYCEQALAICKSIGDRWGGGCALTYLGRILEGLGALEEAESAYADAFSFRRTQAQQYLTIDNLAGLGRIALLRGDLTQAREVVARILAHIATYGVVGVESPLSAYLVCVRILDACGEERQAQSVLEQGYALLMERAGQLNDEALRRSFLEQVSAHRELLEMWEDWQSPKGQPRRSRGSRMPPTF
jgi:tetratricopeptide (TPR) repeat protein